MYIYFDKNKTEAGLDECARGVILGRIYGAAVIYPKEGINEVTQKLIKDSKKLSKKMRNFLFDIIIDKAIDYSISWVDEKVVDEKGIQYANYKVFHDCLDNLDIRPDHILVDGNRFKDYKFNDIPIHHSCIVKGDSKYLSIACASILAKVAHDRYIQELVDKNFYLFKYDLLNNMGYGTKKHIQAISEYGYTKFHRRSYKIKKLNNNFSKNNITTLNL